MLNEKSKLPKASRDPTALEQEHVLRGLKDLYRRQTSQQEVLHEREVIEKELEALKSRRIQAPTEATMRALDAKGSASAIAKEAKAEGLQIRNATAKAKLQAAAVDPAKVMQAQHMEEERKQLEKVKKREQRRQTEQLNADRNRRLIEAETLENKGKEDEGKGQFHDAIASYDKALRVRIHGGLPAIFAIFHFGPPQLSPAHARSACHTPLSIARPPEFPGRFSSGAERGAGSSMPTERDTQPRCEIHPCRCRISCSTTFNSIPIPSTHTHTQQKNTHTHTVTGVEGRFEPAVARLHQSLARCHEVCVCVCVCVRVCVRACVRVRVRVRVYACAGARDRA